MTNNSITFIVMTVILQCYFSSLCKFCYVKSYIKTYLSKNLSSNKSKAIHNSQPWCANLVLTLDMMHKQYNLDPRCLFARQMPVRGGWKIGKNTASL